MSGVSYYEDEGANTRLSDEDAQLVEPMQRLVTSHQRMLMNTEVYAVADRLDIDALKQHAAVKFTNDAKRWPHGNFPAVVQQVLQCTPSNDRYLREVCVDICAQHVRELMGVNSCAEETNDWTTVLREDADFTVAVLRKSVQQTHHEAESRLASEAGLVANIEDLEEENRELAASVTIMTVFQAQKQQLDGALGMNFIDRFLGTLSKYPQCRHCKEPLQYTLESSAGYGYFLRCIGCKTKHSM